MRISALAICSLVAMSFLVPVSLGPAFLAPAFSAQITDNELVRRQKWEADAREARSYQLFATCTWDCWKSAVAGAKGTKQLGTLVLEVRFPSRHRKQFHLEKIAIVFSTDVLKHEVSLRHLVATDNASPRHGKGVLVFHEKL